MSENLHEECGVFGIYNNDNLDVVSSTYLGLYALQHRGQESCGIAVNSFGKIYGYKNTGLVNEVFTQDVIDSLGTGKMAVGHCRYGTQESKSNYNAQPLIVNHVKGRMAISHNGCLTNADKLREELELTGAIFHTSSDSEVIAYAITRERINSDSIEGAIEKAMEKIAGAYSLVIMSPRKLIAVRDPMGFRPLCIGLLENSYVFASETCALDSIGAKFVRDIEPGEIVVCDENGLHSIKTHCGTMDKHLCVFEFIYFARPDSVIDGSSVHLARQRAGAFLALEHPVQADVVIGVPDSGLDAALGYSKQSGIPYGIGFIKNKYIGRTFIQPTQKERANLVRIKLNTISETVKGKRVILIDDSIVRGTTCARIVNLLRDAGATEVHMRISAPPFMHPCYFGTDIDSRDKLIAHNHSNEEIAKIINVDSLGYLSVDNVKKIADSTADGFCCSCFTGEYPLEVPELKVVSKYDKELEM